MRVSLPAPHRLPMLLPGLASLAGFVAWCALSGTEPESWHLTLLLAWFALLGWMHAYRRYRVYADTPLARVRSAPQGYVALDGIGRALAGVPLHAPLSGLPCLWYRLKTESRTRDGKWEVEEDFCSEDSFLLEDDDGARCAVCPIDAQIEVFHQDVSVDGDTRRTQWVLIPGTQLHVIGDFRSRRPIEDRDSAHAEVRERLAEWKRSGEAQRRFDRDASGALDMAEWEDARRAAQAEVHVEREAAKDHPAYHLLQAPADGRPFVISDKPPAQVRRRYQAQAWVTLGLFFLALLATAWMRTHP
ncbi:MAG: hypothetical protein REI09_06415 [Candidatus Dactylopiibacterium sp.]|nr:hypothetical protein [Candidatus Dactylopiibacterium sp.]